MRIQVAFTALCALLSRTSHTEVRRASLPTRVTQGVVQLDVEASALGGVPSLVTSARSGHIILLEQGRLPSVFSPQGAFVGTLGRKGKGPGELTIPTWVDGDLDDSVRVVDVDRIVVFDRALRPVRTIMGPGRQLIWHATFLRRGALASQSMAQDPADDSRPVPIVVRSDSGTILSSIEIAKINEHKTFIALGRALDSPRSFWLAEWTAQKLAGYRVSLVGEDGRRQRTLSLGRAWWIGSDFKANPVAAVSRIREIRQIDDRHVAVLISQPRPGWERMPVDPRTMEGHHRRFQTLVETIDIVSGALVSSAMHDGYPISLLDRDRVSVYQEAGDGTPSVSVLAIRSLEQKTPR